MKLLITGGTGYLGKGVIERCLQEGYEIVLLGRHKVKSMAGVTFIAADITSKEQLKGVRAAVGDVTTLIHLAAKVPKELKEDLADDMVMTNVLGSLNILEVFGGKLEHVIYGSTAEVYGLPQTAAPITEQQLPVPMSNYGASKLAGELFIRAFCAKKGIPCTMLRFSVMYGQPDTISRAIPNFISRAKRGEPLEIYGGEELRDYLHVDDASESIVCAVRAKKDGVYNIGSGAATSVQEAAKAILQATKSSSELRILPRQKKAADLVFDSSSAGKDLGYHPVHVFPSGLETQL